MAEPAFEALLMEHSRETIAKDALAKIAAAAAVTIQAITDSKPLAGS